MRTIGHRSTVVGLTFALAGAWLLSGVAVAADPTGDISGASTGGLLPNSAAKSTLVQDPTFLSEKAAGLISVDASGAPIVLSAAQPASGSGSGALTFLDTQWAVEPEGRYYDDLHHAESDLNLLELLLGRLGGHGHLLLEQQQVPELAGRLFHRAVRA